ncbi:MAG TPA: 16S rRNA (cytosine(1402)-N(4))-methyltransferase RsmH [Dehalococcoidia bacterium]|nr:16S rRNA (cytosine(1402)-N(4))-methyltransferase RsmH [Dehalococcoidia bacterium]
MSPQNNVLVHNPVLPDEVIRYLAVEPGGRYIDCTLGAGGHARAILERGAPGAMLIGFDADPHAISLARDTLKDFEDSVDLINGNFRDLKATAENLNFVPAHGVLFDLGLSSMQLAEEGRGFSFQYEAPLDMRFGPDQTVTAADIVNEYDKNELANVIWEFGEERFSRRIASAIIRARPLKTTTELAAIVSKAVPGTRSRIHPATRTFQALRIAVNDELNTLQTALEQARDVLGSGGRLVVISFHSLEDRIVKQYLQRESRDCICPPETPVCVCGHSASLRVLTRRPVTPTPEEMANNPRSRSAKLRAAERVGAEAHGGD